jgi:hypothetical protein
MERRKRGSTRDMSKAFLFFRKGAKIMKKENDFQSELIKELKKMFPGCIVMKNDPRYIQGIPDLIILYGKKWASLECKKSKDAPSQPNQPYYVERMNNMSFSRFIFPENKEDVLNELQRSFSH